MAKNSDALEARVLVVDPCRAVGIQQKLEAHGLSTENLIAADDYSEAAVLVESLYERLVAAVVALRPRARCAESMAVREPADETNELPDFFATLRATGTPAYGVACGASNTILETLYALGALDPDASGLIPVSHLDRLADRFSTLLDDRLQGSAARYSLQLARDRSSTYERPLYCRHPATAAKHIYDLLKNYEREALGALYLDARNRAMGHTIAYLGTVRRCIAEPRGIFVPALLGNSSALILFHNHPSGDPHPSKADIELTNSMVEAGEILQVRVVDHIIVAEDGAYTSLRERGLL